MYVSDPEVPVSRIQLALDVDDLETAVGFYARLLGTGPAKRRPGYANFVVADPPLKLVLIEEPGRGGGLDHLGIEVESTAQVRAEVAGLSGEGLGIDEEMGTTCCFAVQDEVWVTGPGGERWEVHTVLAASDASATGPVAPAGAGQAPTAAGCC